VHRGDHEPILERALFEAVQARLTAQAVERRCRLRGSCAVLTGRLFDERGNRMSPSHTNKRGVRYRYYVSQAVLHNRPAAAGALARVPGAEIEALIMTALRNHLQATGTAIPDNERELVQRHVERVTLTPKSINLQLRQLVGAPDGDHTTAHPGGTTAGPVDSPLMIAIPWTGPVCAPVKGITHVPAHNTPIRPDRREALLIAIAKARKWVDDLAHDRAASFAALARREGKLERQIRLLVPLAFLSPRIVSALLDGSAPAGLTVTALARALPLSWVEQELRVVTQSSRGSTQ
jgi:hypothetical protein